MTESDWDAKYRAAPRDVPEPDRFLAEALPYLPAAKHAQAVDLACGGGRNALQLARWGYQVRAIDLSAAALRLCTERAEAVGVQLETARVDLEDPGVDLGRDSFDIVTVFNFLHRPLIGAIMRSVRPGGVVIYKTYTRNQLRFGSGPRNRDYLLKQNELPRLFAGFRHVIYKEECETNATAALVTQRP